MAFKFSRYKLQRMLLVQPRFYSNQIKEFTHKGLRDLKPIQQDQIKFRNFDLKTKDQASFNVKTRIMKEVDESQSLNQEQFRALLKQQRHNMEKHSGFFLLIFKNLRVLLEKNKLDYSDADWLAFLQDYEEIAFRGLQENRNFKTFKGLVNSGYFHSVFINKKFKANRLYILLVENFKELLKIGRLHSEGNTVLIVLKVLKEQAPEEYQMIQESLEQTTLSSLSNQTPLELINSIKMNLFTMIEEAQSFQQKHLEDNVNPFHDDKFSSELEKFKNDSLFYKVKTAVDKKLINNELSIPDFFKLMSFEDAARKEGYYDLQFRFIQNYDEEVLKFIQSHLKQFTDYQLITTLYNLSKSTSEMSEKFTHANFFAEYFSFLKEERIQAMTQQSVLSVIRSIGRLAFKNQDVEDIARIAKQKLRSGLNLKQKSIALGAFANVNLISQDEEFLQELLRGFIHEYKERHSKFAASYLLDFAKTLAKMDHWDEEFSQFMQEEVPKILQYENNIFNLQIYYLDMYLKLDRQQSYLEKDSYLFKKIEELHNKNQKSEAKYLKHNQNNFIRNLLKEKDLKFVEEYLDVFRVDFAVSPKDSSLTNKEAMVLIELDGPHHFIAPDKAEITLTTSAKRRILKKKGYELLSVPFYYSDAQMVEAIDQMGKLIK